MFKFPHQESGNSGALRITSDQGPKTGFSQNSMVDNVHPEIHG
jgi:hypothetical protein